MKSPTIAAVLVVSLCGIGVGGIGVGALTAMGQSTVAATRAKPAATKVTTKATAKATTSTAKPTTKASSGKTVAATAVKTSDSGSLTSITVPSTTAEYFVLYVKPDLSKSLEFPVAIAKGKDGTTTLTDHRAKLPEKQYRVATFPVNKPGDVDADGIDDLTELADPKHLSPLNGAPKMDITNGTPIIADRAMFETLSYQGNDVARDSYLAGLEYVKFWIIDIDTDHPKVYFMNTESFRAHPMFAGVVGIQGGRGPSFDKMRGDIVYNPKGIAPDGSKGTYRFAFQPQDAYSFDQIVLAFESLSSSMPFLTNNLLYYPFPDSALPLYTSEKPLYDGYRVPILFD
jgi:hypothetical protein